MKNRLAKKLRYFISVEPPDPPILVIKTLNFDGVKYKYDAEASKYYGAPVFVLERRRKKNGNSTAHKTVA